MAYVFLVLFILPLGILLPFPAGINALFSHGPQRSVGLARLYALWNINSVFNVVVALICGYVHFKSQSSRSKKLPYLQPWGMAYYIRGKHGKVASFTKSKGIYEMVVKVLWLILFCVTFGYGYGVDVKTLNVGEELFKETLPLHMGSRYYQLQGLKPNTWYEVKISYPASIPAVFSLELKKDISGVGVRRLRKLLNTEKLIFMAENLDKINHQDGLYVLITVEPEGVVALRGVRERENILFNIVCDELVMGIPREAWLVAAFGVTCIVVGFLVPLFFPSFLMPKNQDDFKHVTQLLPDKDS